MDMEELAGHAVVHLGKAREAEVTDADRVEWHAWQRGLAVSEGTHRVAVERRVKVLLIARRAVHPHGEAGGEDRARRVASQLFAVGWLRKVKIIERRSEGARG